MILVLDIYSNTQDLILAFVVGLKSSFFFVYQFYPSGPGYKTNGRIFLNFHVCIAKQVKYDCCEVSSLNIDRKYSKSNVS